MSHCVGCKSGGINYKFIDEANDFYSASKLCGPGARLATNLKAEDYAALNACCKTSNRYRIGLIYDDTCRNNELGNFHWNDERNCTDGSPLTVINKLTASKCQAAVIQIDTLEKNLLQAELRDCDESFGYVCQQAATASTLSTTTTSVATASTPSITSQHSLTPLQSSSIAYNLTKNLTTPSCETLHPEVIATIGACCLIVFILSIALCTWYHKKTSSKSNKNEDAKKEIGVEKSTQVNFTTTQDANNFVYSK